MNVFWERKVYIEPYTKVSISVSRVKKITENSEGEMRGDILLLILRMKNNEFSFIGVQFKITETSFIVHLEGMHSTLIQIAKVF